MLKNRKVLQKDVTDFAVDGAKSDVAIVFAGNTMGVVMGDTYTHLSDNSTHDFFYVDGTLYYFDEYNEYSVPYSVGMVGLIYNTSIVKETPDSWSIMWDEKYAGNILTFDNIGCKYGCRF